jgi:hypothetical protein
MAFIKASLIYFNWGTFKTSFENPNWEVYIVNMSLILSNMNKETLAVESLDR